MEVVVRAYVYASCSSCRNAEAFLAEQGATVERRDFFKQRFTVDELRGVLASAAIGPRDVLSLRSKVYKARSAEIDALDDADLLSLMTEEPTLLRRPLVIGVGGHVVGFDRAELAALVASER